MSMELLLLCGMTSPGDQSRRELTESGEGESAPNETEFFLLQDRYVSFEREKSTVCDNLRFLLDCAANF